MKDETHLNHCITATYQHRPRSGMAAILNLPFTGGHFEFLFGPLNFWILHVLKYMCANFHACVTNWSIFMVICLTITLPLNGDPLNLPNLDTPDPLNILQTLAPGTSMHNNRLDSYYHPYNLLPCVQESNMHGRFKIIFIFVWSLVFYSENILR